EYDDSQRLGAEMREAGVEAFVYPSARDLKAGKNVGVFTPTVFGRSRPKVLETWYCSASRERVDFARGDYFNKERFEFLRAQFLVNGKLPHPAV
ncbi:MAG TPA: RES domain-containing protein, partial [Gemmatimonadaceae bacterium]